MVEVPFCSECGEELRDVNDIDEGLCLDCQMDLADDPDRDSEDE